MGGNEAANGDFASGTTDAAVAIVTALARGAMTASASRFDHHSITGDDAPAARGVVSNLLYDADGFVAGNHRQSENTVELAVELIDVAAADSAGFDAQQGVVSADPRQLELLHLETCLADLNYRSRLCHTSTAGHADADGVTFLRGATLAGCRRIGETETPLNSSEAALRIKSRRRTTIGCGV